MSGKKSYGYYPGCSLKGIGVAYEESLLAVCRALDVDLEELADWNCCGATAYMGVDQLQAYALAARNLALSEVQGKDLVAPCSACYLVLNKTQRRLHEDSTTRKLIGDALQAGGIVLDGEGARVRHPLDVLVNDVGLEAIRQRITHSLSGLKVAPYYGCQIVRPYAEFDDQRDPTAMDRLISVTGATPIDFSLKTKCCGGSQTGTLPEIGQRLVFILLQEAQTRGADIIATVCPLCQFNLEAYQDECSKRWGECSVPVIYFTQLLGLALGLSWKELGMQRSLADARAVLEERALEREATYA